MRIKLLIAHVTPLLGSDDASGGPQIASEEFVGVVLYPSVHVVIDFLYVRNWRGFRLIIGILMSLWLLVPFAIIHMAYTVLVNYRWNPFLTALYVLILVVGIYSFSHMMRAQQADFYFDFSD